MYDSTRIAEINNDNWPDQKQIDAEATAAREAKFQKMLSDSKFHNPARNPLVDAWGDLLVDDENLHDLIKITMQSKTANEERENRAKACAAIFEALEKTLWDWAD